MWEIKSSGTYKVKTLIVLLIFVNLNQVYGQDSLTRKREDLLSHSWGLHKILKLGSGEEEVNFGDSYYKITFKKKLVN